MPEELVVKDRKTRTKLLEYVVDKRTRTLDYLRTLHTTGDALWMNSVRITTDDLSRYFLCTEGGVGSQVDVTVSLAQPHSRSPSGTPGSASLPSPSAAVRHVTRTQGATAPPEWVAQHCKEWLVLGLSLGSLIQYPVGGVDFLTIVHEMLLEFDVHFASNSASRALASRTLKKDREQRGLKHDAGIKTILANGAFAYLVLPPIPFSGTDVPSYDVLVSPLCSTLQFVYRKLCDYDIAEDENTFKRLLAVDRRLKHVFFGAISKQLAKLSEVKLAQQRQWISQTLFGAFSHVEGVLLQELMQPPRHADPSTTSPGQSHLALPPPSSEYRADRDSMEYYFDDDDEED